MLTKAQLQHIQDNLKSEFFSYIEHRNQNRSEHSKHFYSRAGYSKDDKVTAIHAMRDLFDNSPGALGVWEANHKRFRAILEDGSLGLKLTAFYQEAKDIPLSGVRTLPATNLHDFLKLIASMTIAKNNRAPTAHMDANQSTGALNTSRRTATLSDDSRDSVANTRASMQQIYSDL